MTNPTLKQALADYWRASMSELTDNEGEKELERLQSENAMLRRANRTREDYNLTCQECGKAHILDTSLPSEIWNQIAKPEDVLCTLCIDEKLQAAGLTCDCAEFYYVGFALSSRPYAQDEEARKLTGEGDVTCDLEDL